MSRIRVQRLEKELMRLISNTVNFKLRDQRLSMISITAVRLTNDFSVARIYFTQLDTSDPVETEKALTRSSGFIKKEIAAAHLMRSIPDLRFAYDKLEENAQRLDDIFASLHAKEKEEDDAPAPHTE